jgi:molybdate transport system substrate-binding protein
MLFRLLLSSILAALLMVSPGQTETINVFAAASLKNALDEVGDHWRDESGHEARMVYAASPALAKQIAEGAPAGVFISADAAWMDELQARSLIVAASRIDLLGNSLVLIAPASSAVQTTIGKPFDLAALLGDGRLAVADVSAVPAGKYAKAALQTLGAWNGVADHLAQTENVRAALALVARGEAPLGIVYGSDALAEPQVKVVAVFPDDSHPAIIFPAAVVSASENASAVHFVRYLSSAGARAIFVKHGFTPLR